jgi:hypothetical protein
VTISFLDQVRVAAQKRILFLQHALDEMNAPHELITPDEVRSVVMFGEIIEDYIEDVRGHSCLMLGFGTDLRPIHVLYMLYALPKQTISRS